MPPPADALVHLAGVRVVRDGAVLLDDVDWTVRAGERWAVLGPNGAGKTTLMAVVGATAFPTAGVVELLAERLGEVDLRELQDRIGMASASLADRLPGRERALDLVVSAAYGQLGRARAAYDDAEVARARSLLRGLGCGALADRTFRTLSEGERKRVQIARALMTDPELLVLDEPAAGLDLGAREALVMRLSRLAADPAAPALVLVTHHVEEVPRGFTHALLLRGGRVVAAGPVERTLTAEALSACFGVPLQVEHREGRWSARIVMGPPPSR